MPTPPLRLSVLSPCRDERRALARYLAGVEAALEAAGLAGRFEVVVADGASTDGTRAWLERARAGRPWLRVLDNPDRTPASGRNVALRAARGELVAIVDVHWVLDRDYFRVLLPGLDAPGVGAVGGTFVAADTDERVQRLVGLALQSPLATGPGMRVRARARPGWREAPTVPGGVFRREVLERVGPFDERLVRSEDDALMARLRGAGLRVLQNPGAHVGYLPRRTFRALLRQYHGYGVYKRYALGSPGWGAAQWLPLALVAYLATAAGTLAVRPRLGAAALAAYPLALGAADRAWRGRAGARAPLAVLWPMALMQLGYGAGLWRGLLLPPRRGTARTVGRRTPGPAASLPAPSRMAR